MLGVSRSQKFWRATYLLGGVTARDEEIGYNSFGKELAFEFEHIFNPTTATAKFAPARSAALQESCQAPCVAQTES